MRCCPLLPGLRPPDTVTRRTVRPLSLSWTPVAIAAALVATQMAGRHAHAADAAQPAAAASAPSSDEIEQLRSTFNLTVPVAGKKRSNQLPLYFEADHVEGHTDDKMKATGTVKLRQGDIAMRTDEVTYTQANDTAHAVGRVRITRQGDVFVGPELTLKLDTLEGEFIRPSYWFGRTAAGGRANLIEFLGSNRLRATQATYSSCTPNDLPDGSPGSPDWVLSTSQVDMDFDANEGRAQNAVIRFLGVPILAAPVLTFPLRDERKSGWLAPSFDVDNKAGFELAVPYYWNIAPNQDMTLTPSMSTRRGGGADVEYRYLTPEYRGTLHVAGLPYDQVAGEARGMVDYQHQGVVTESDSPTLTNYELRWRRVSDDDYWKDFSGELPSLTPRLYDSHASVERQLNTRNWGLGASQTTLYANVQTWQTLRDMDTLGDPSTQITAPYRREPQMGVRSRSTSESGWTWQMQGEFNRFTNEDATKVAGNRLHAIGQVERTFGDLNGYTLTPRLSVRSVNYSLDGNTTTSTREASLTVPTFSLDGNVTFERNTTLFGHDMVQTLEPRAMYVYTPYRKQSNLPLFDTAERDFNQYSIFSESDFTGMDRINDANQLTLGVTTRWLDPKDGAEAVRLGVVQKVLFADQRITPNDGAPITQRLSDLLLLASTNIAQHWFVDSTQQSSAQGHQNQRTTMSLRYTPADWHTVSLSYRYARDSSEQVDLGWQWPLSRNFTPPTQTMAQQAASASASLNFDGRRTGGTECKGTWYSVGRLSYSMRDEHMTDALVGFEYDAGCWIGRIVAQRSLTGSDASTKFMFQLELVGLSRLGSSPLHRLKNDIPGYKLLRDDNSMFIPANSTSDQTDD